MEKEEAKKTLRKLYLAFEEVFKLVEGEFKDNEEEYFKFFDYVYNGGDGC